MQSEDEALRNFLGTDVLFHNEIIFYEYFDNDYVEYPKCDSMVQEPIHRAVIVLENVTQSGYKGIPSKQDLGIKRVLAAVREIGKFHARGYVMKEKRPELFFRLTNKLREVMYNDSAVPAMIHFFNSVSIRPINYLRSINYDSEFCDKMSNVMKNAHETILKDCVKPRNELAVLCHGDFTSNNVLLREEDCDEFNARLIDFAQLRYASPATDISIFIHLSYEEDVRKNFPEVFKAYHDAVFQYLREAGIQDLAKYSFDAFLKDYKSALIGCEIIVYFMPSMYIDQPNDFDNLLTRRHFENHLTIGGVEFSKKLAGMIIELR